MIVILIVIHDFHGFMVDLNGCFPSCSPPERSKPQLFQGCNTRLKGAWRAMRGWHGTGNGEMDTPGTPGVVGRC